MKTTRFTRRFAAAVFTTAAASLLYLADLANAQPSPVLSTGIGTWDMVISGQRRGTAQVQFFNDFTLLGYQLTTLPPLKSPDIDPRTGLPESAGNDLLNRTNVVGEAILSGVWSFNLAGSVIGSYVEIIAISEGGTNRIVENGYSFSASVNPQRAIVVSAKGPAGNVKMRCKPTIPLNDLSLAPYYGTAKADNQSFTEFFTLMPTATPNVYDVSGSGPTYSYSGTAMLIRQGNLSMVTGSTDGTNNVVRAVSGIVPFKKSPLHGNLSGIQTDALGNVRLRINP